MPEATLERRKCDGCGTAIREGSQFCYYCGRSIGVCGKDARPATIDHKGSRGLEAIAAASEAPFVPSPIAKPSVPLTTENEGQKGDDTKPFPRKRKPNVRAVTPVEFEWVEPTATIWRPFFAAAVFAFVVGLMLLAAWALK